MTAMTVHIRQRGVLTLPAERRRRYDIDEGDALPERQAILQQLLGHVGQNSIIEPPFYCACGRNIHPG